MFIYSFKFKTIRIVAWLLLVLFLVAGVYFMYAEKSEEIPEIKESVEVWQV